MIQQHIIELSNRYQLTISDSGFVLYPLERDNEGRFKRSGGQYCTNFEAVVETLQKRELNNEDVISLADCAKVLSAIKAEIHEIRARIND